MSVEIVGYGSKHSHEFKLTLTETSYDTVNNTSVLSYSFTVYKSSYSWTANNISYLFSINGTDFTGYIPSYNAGATLTLASGSMTINHNADGTKVVGSYFNVYDGSGASYACGNASGSGNITLTTIPRSITVSASLDSKTYNSVTINWTTSGASSGTRYRLNKTGLWIDAVGTTAPDTKSGTFTITGLNANTQYTIETACLGTQAQLWYYAPNDIVVTTNPANISITTTDIDFR